MRAVFQQYEHLIIVSRLRIGLIVDESDNVIMLTNCSQHVDLRLERALQHIIYLEFALVLYQYLLTTCITVNLFLC